jgi:regulatory protein
MKSGRITGLSPQQKNKERVNVYLDDHFAFGLATIVAARLKVGQVLTEGDVARLRARDEGEEAYDKSIRYLGYRPRSRAEIDRYLKDKKVSEEMRATVLDRLARGELVNDGEFARFWVENREQFAPRGKRALRAELRQKGLSDEEVQTALANVDEERSAYEAAQKRAARMTSLDREIFIRRLSGFLERRGFGYDVVRTVVARLWQERGLGPWPGGAQPNSEEMEE